MVAFLNKPVIKTIENDPVYTTTASFYRIAAEVSKGSGQYDAALATGKRLWIAALMEMAPEKTLYPDANSTMRLSYGTIQDYDPKDAVTYKYYTTLQGVVDKYKPADYEFDLPKRLIELNSKIWLFKRLYACWLPYNKRYNRRQFRQSGYERKR
jgi:hypothetical protein